MKDSELISNPHYFKFLFRRGKSVELISERNEKDKKNDYEFKLMVENLPNRNMPLNPVSNVSYKNNNKIMNK